MASRIALGRRGELPPSTGDEIAKIIARVRAAVLAQVTSSNLQDRVAPTDVAYQTSFFLQGTGTWTVDQADINVFRYSVLNGYLTLTFSASTTTLSGVTGDLRLLLPAGYVAKRPNGKLPCVGTFAWTNSGGTATSTTGTSSNPKAATGAIFVGTDGTYLNLRRNDPTVDTGAGFTDGTNTYGFHFTAVIELQ